MHRIWTFSFVFAAAFVGCDRDDQSVAPTQPQTSTAQPDGQSPQRDALGDYQLPAGTLKAREAITAPWLREMTETLSSDRFEGRGPGSPGDAAARKWLASQLEQLGFVPAGSEGFEQPFPIVGVEADMPKSWAFAAGRKKLSLNWSSQYIAASGVQEERVAVEDAEVVFVGYGIDAPEQNWNDYGDADLQGKVLLMLNHDPSGSPEHFGGDRRLYYGRWTYKYEEAARRGAAGAIIIHTKPSAGYPWSVVQTSWSGMQYGLPAGEEPRTPIHAWVTEDAAKALASLGGHDLDQLIAKAQERDFAPVPLGVTTSLSFRNELERTQTANVAGQIVGREDPEKVVVVTAHHDHLGKDPSIEGSDVIYNGARDNATGAAQALGVARALATLQQPPRRSVIVLFVGAEEQGLLGSLYYAKNPTFATESEPSDIVANINFELGNIWGPTKDVVIHGMGKNDLDTRVAAAASLQDRTVHGEADPSAGWYYRSDQFSFARQGIPSLWFESGRDFEGRPEGWGDEVVSAWIGEHYHQPSDEVTPQWNFEGMAEDARLGFLVVAALAEDPAVPKWAPGDEFAGRR